MGNLCSRNCTPFFLFPRGSSIKKTEKKDSFENLVDTLVTMTAAEDNLTGQISRAVFTQRIFSNYLDFSNRMFNYLTDTNFTNVPPVLYITKERFNLQIRKLFDPIPHEDQCIMYMSLYSADNEMIELDQFKSFLVFIYDISMDNHPDGPQICFEAESMISSVVNSVYRKGTSLRIEYVLQWIEHNTPRLVGILHNFIIREMEVCKRYSKVSTVEEQDLRSSILSSSRSYVSEAIQSLPLSRIWILSTLLPTCYTKPYDDSNMELPDITNISMTSQYNYSADFEGIPNHWKLLYESQLHGCSGNRFSYHVFGYRGPTLMFLKCANNVDFCACTTEEWHESHRAWGDKFCYLIQLLPLFYVIDKGPKLLFLNFTFKGFPMGMRLGTDRNKPFIVVNDQLNQLSYRGVSHSIYSIEVWGCGSTQAKNLFKRLKTTKALQIIKESVISIKGSVSHPDKYLVDLASRPDSGGVL